ncbi:MAG: RtcB family protein [Burkholderiales bacterium]|jgi:tRNA-splicing ligase RtcB|nr:RtcB family protein [Burkholderiales bacterium]
MPILKTLNKARIPVRVWTDEIEPEAIQQLLNVANLPIVYQHIAAMPDVHMGIGAAIGSVIATRAAIIPAAVGVDIGCGMNATRLSLIADELPDNLSTLRDAIEKVVPVGFAQHDFDEARSDTHMRVVRLLDTRLDTIVGKHPELTKMQRQFANTWRAQLGTLGGGNHFIELCFDEARCLWVMLHSGSRGIGNVLGRYFIAEAKKEMQRHQIHLPDKDLAYLKEGSEQFDDYVEAVSWAQDYALFNRQIMMQLIVEALRPLLPPFSIENEVINCHHNYVQQETHFGKTLWITRKGAISAHVNELGIIPGSMGTKSYIVRGLGNEQSFCSCSHGAGRRMSRSEAKRRFNSLDLAKQTEGIECRKDSSVIDEIPGAYKDIDQVMTNQSDLVEIVYTLKQILCVKG